MPRCHDADGGQAARGPPASVGLNHERIETQHEIPAKRGKCACRVGLVEQTGNPTVIVVADKIAGTVTAIMADMERFVSFGCRGVVSLDRRVGEIYAAGLVEVGSHLLAGGLCADGERQSESEQREDKFFHYSGYS